MKKKKIHNYTTNKVQIFFDSDEYNSDDEILEKIQMEKNSDYEENSNKEILEKIQIKKIVMKRTLLKKILVKKILVKKIQAKKILMQKIKYYYKLPDYRRNCYLTNQK